MMGRRLVMGLLSAIAGKIKDGSAVICMPVHAWKRTKVECLDWKLNDRKRQAVENVFCI
jgi:hypothetical protein